MKTSRKHGYILERFLPIQQLPCLSLSILPSNECKKLILLRNVYIEQKCLMKIQPLNVLQSKSRNILHQASFFQKFQGHIGIPLQIWSGQDFDCLVLVLEELGMNIYQRMKSYTKQNKFNLKDTCMIGLQLIDIVKNLHQKQHLHRNISPQSFSFGRNVQINKLYVNDLLYTKRYIIKNTDTHIEENKFNKLKFLTPFLSTNVLNCKEPSRRDDLVSIVYLLIYLMKGKLPWQGNWENQIIQKLKFCDKKDNNKKFQDSFVFWQNNSRKSQQTQEQMRIKVQKMKYIQQATNISQLCQGLPQQFQSILTMVNELQFSQTPEYQKYQAYLKKILFKNRLKNDLLFSWMQSQNYFNHNLKVNTHIINLSTTDDDQILSQIYTPFEQKTDIDPIANLINRQRDTRQKQDPSFRKPINQNNNFQILVGSQNSITKSKKSEDCRII